MTSSWVCWWALLVPYTMAATIPFMPPAREVATLYPTSDGLNFNVRIYAGTPVQQVHLVFDTASADTVVFTRTLCVAGPTAGTSATTDCYDIAASSSAVPSSFAGATKFTYRRPVLADNEQVTDAAVGRVTETLSVPTYRTGQTASVRASTTVQATIALSDDMQVTVAAGSVHALHGFNFSNGIMGAGYNGLAAAVIGTSAFLRLMDVFPYDADDQAYLLPIFSVDMPFPTNAGGALDNGRLYVGGVDEKARPHLQWAPPLGAARYHEFQAYNMRVCGASLMTLSSSYRTRVDTGASCLGLAQELFDMVVSWVPVECNSPGDICFLPNGVQPLLPTLSFSLDDDDAQSLLLHIPLHVLLVKQSVLNNPDAANEYRYCMTRLAPLDELTANNKHHVVMGTRPLLALHFAADMKTRQVALGNKQAFNTSTVQCRIAKVCAGMQRRDAATNTCHDPDCGKYYFFEFDASSRECKLSVAFHVLAVLFVTTVVAVEVLLRERGKRIVQGVLDTVTAT